MTTSRTRRRSEHSYVDGWPSFAPLAVTPAEKEQQENFARQAASLIARRFCDDDTTRTELLGMLFAPPRETPLYRSRTS